MIEKIIESDLSNSRKALAINLIDPSNSQDVAASIIYLIEEFDLKFHVDKDHFVSLIGDTHKEKSTPYILILIDIKILLSIIINYIIYKRVDLNWPMFKTWLPPKYLNLLNLSGELPHLDLSEVVKSANPATLNKIIYLDKLNKLASKLGFGYKANALAFNDSLSKSNKNNNLDCYRQDSEATRPENGNGSEANTEANASSKLTIMMTSPDSEESIKEALKSERAKRNIRSRKVVEHLRMRIEEYNIRMGLASYFPNDWFAINLTSVYRMRKIIDPDMIVKAIDWFYNDRWWCGKISNMSQIEKHYNKFAASQRGKNGAQLGLLSQKLKELSGK